MRGNVECPWAHRRRMGYCEVDKVSRRGAARCAHRRQGKPCPYAQANPIGERLLRRRLATTLRVGLPPLRFAQGFGLFGRSQ
jgi:hypothetical protein